MIVLLPLFFGHGGFLQLQHVDSICRLPLAWLHDLPHGYILGILALLDSPFSITSVTAISKSITRKSFNFQKIFKIWKKISCELFGFLIPGYVYENFETSSHKFGLETQKFVPSLCTLKLESFKLDFLKRTQEFEWNFLKFLDWKNSNLIFKNSIFRTLRLGFLKNNEKILEYISNF